mgnify:CR=1 FL=1
MRPIHKNRLWDILEKSVLPFVSKPGRYVGNEFNVTVKEHTGRLKIALAFPDIYEVGSSYLGLQILYHLINGRDNCVAERVFQVWPDMEAKLRQSGLPLFTLETSTPLAEFDVIGFSVTYEMHATGILNMLDLAGIPLRAADRNERYPLVIAGGPAIVNPEPLADFFDAMFLGEAEESLNELLYILIENKGKRRQEVLTAMAAVPGMYIPSFHRIEIAGGNGRRNAAAFANAPAKVKIQSCRQLKADYYPQRPLVPFLEITHDRLSIEIMRGCMRGCRFCQAGYQYRPRRYRQARQIIEQVVETIKSTGYDELTLLSLSSTDYPGLESLLQSLSEQAAKLGFSISLPSLRPGTLNSLILRILKTGRKGGLTFAPEAGTQRLRDMLGKDITEDEILGGIRLAFAEDWQLIKLYFMIGLPGETEADIEGIAELLKKTSSIARQAGRNRKINVTISPFCPKPGTPWQWERQLTADETSSVYQRLRRLVNSRNVFLKFRNPDLAVLEGILGRGDRRLSEVIYEAYKNGSRLDGWSEHFRFEYWRKAFEKTRIDPLDYLREKATSDSLPWDHIEKGIPKRYLLWERDKAKAGLPVYKRKIAVSRVMPMPDDHFGRTPRPRRNGQATALIFQTRVKYARDERMRFYSHLDIMRALQRAIKRADLPVALSHGHNRHMKLAFGHPLPLGYVSKAEYFDLQTERPLDSESMVRLKDNLPQGLSIEAAKFFTGDGISLVRAVNLISYRAYLDRNAGIGEDRIKSLRESPELIIERNKPNSSARISARELLLSISLNGEAIEMELALADDKSLRPSEVLIYGLGLSVETVLPMIIERTGQYHLQGIHRTDPLQLV